MYCYKCGNELPERAKFCFKCGTAISGNTGITQKKERAAARSKKKQMMLIVAVLVLTLGLYAVRGIVGGSSQASGSFSSSSFWSDKNTSVFPCSSCNGSKKCSSCGGTGKTHYYAAGGGTIESVCPYCSYGKCRACGGTGRQ